MDIHYEKDLVINGRIISYKGIFRYDEVFRIINKTLEKKGYQKREKKSEELVKEEGKKTFVELRPYKHISNYVTLLIKIKIDMDNITEMSKKFETGMKKFQQGDLTFTFDAWLLSDYRNRWGMKPWAFFIKGVIRKLLYRWPLEDSYRDELVGDTAYLNSEIKKLLKSYQPSSGGIVKDSEVREKVAEEIKKEMEKQ
tara:strand:- start:284 stop:874 length:591 start_codon:yes stop_codon:yes gene_type:complete